MVFYLNIKIIEKVVKYFKYFRINILFLVLFICELNGILKN